MKTKQDGVGAQLSFALYGAANRVVRLHKPFLDPLGLTFPQYLVILELLSGSPRSVGELCERLGMETGTMTPILKRLQIAGMITRTRDVNDERRVLIDLTDASRAIGNEVRAITGRIRAACQLTEQGIQALRRTLDALGHPAAE
ncbi:MarR family winged helix-turn-helix transcriptional regulator [Archangium primigenium]|uniref:MarR family winged helix-turn-helix transcriptional regulator n=1 Tax=[Archangium] primigenium TaxID=2792470 RepID=UPI001956965C|nr:MarR family transcriptional regulator [Archangium primigenium]MBM7114352.1 MarR family transcriptional regulator [Archangium primigenium]